MAQSTGSLNGNYDTGYAYLDSRDENMKPRIPQGQTPEYENSKTSAPSRRSTQDSQPPIQQPQPRSIPPSASLNNVTQTIPATTQDIPDLVAQITEQVLQNLTLKGITTTAPQTSTNPTSYQSSNENAKIVPPRNVYTPPSPERYDVPNMATIPGEFRDYELDPVVETSSRGNYSDERPSTSPNPTSTSIRPKGPVRASTGDATTLEKIWQPLFDATGQPTPRLGQFLRGLAVHIIEDFEPQHSLVISPAKMLKFYETVKITDEIYPWASIFGGRISSSSLSHLYRDLHCQHHFIQTTSDDKPSVPALTPQGFETWMSLVIRANPDTEYRRFSDAVLNMPINNADNIKERFPKELSRRLFPAESDPKVLMDLEDAIYADPVIELTQTASTQSQSTQNASFSSQTHMGKPPSPVSKQQVPPPTLVSEKSKTVQSESVLGEASTPVAIERERKPYVSQPGAGKVYEGEVSKGEPTPKRSNSTSQKKRTHFTENQDDYTTASSINRTDRAAMPPALGPSTSAAQTVHTANASNGPPPVQYRRRQRSPSISNHQYTRSSETPSTDYSAYSNTASSRTAELDGDDDRRYKPRYSSEDNEPRSYVASSGPRVAYADDRYARGRRSSVQAGTGATYGGFTAPPTRYG